MEFFSIHFQIISIQGELRQSTLPLKTRSLLTYLNKLTYSIVSLKGNADAHCADITA